MAKHVVVVGAGIVGSATAYAFAREGWRVTLVERATRPGEGVSSRNGGQLTYANVEPLASPHTLRQLPKWLFERSAPIRWRPRADLRHLAWLASFMRACTGAAASRTTIDLLALASRSKRVLHEWLPDLDAGGLQAAHYSAPGKLIVHRKQASRARAEARQRWLGTLGCQQEVVDAQDCLRIEPALAHDRGEPLAFGVWTAGEEVVDTGAMARLLASASGAVLLAERTVTGFHKAGRRVQAVSFDDHSSLDADHVVVAAGTETVWLTRLLGWRAPIEPIKGYSITLDLSDTQAAPVVSISDSDRRIVYGRLGPQLRVVGFADICGSDLSIDNGRIQALVDAADHMFPGARDRDAGLHPWAGLRPATPGSRPLIGGFGLDNVSLNAGHGALGLTLAIGSADLLVRGVIGRSTPQEQAVFRVC